MNVSVRRAGSTELGKRVEMKNMNSLRGIVRAIEYEAKRQVALVEEGGPEAVPSETRLFNAATGATAVMRTKESSLDYRCRGVAWRSVAWRGRGWWALCLTRSVNAPSGSCLNRICRRLCYPRSTWRGCARACRSCLTRSRSAWCQCTASAGACGVAARDWCERARWMERHGGLARAGTTARRWCQNRGRSATLRRLRGGAMRGRRPASS